jgi:hypothetical protein
MTTTQKGETKMNHAGRMVLRTSIREISLIVQDGDWYIRVDGYDPHYWGRNRPTEQDCRAYAEMYK